MIATTLLFGLFLAVVGIDLWRRQRELGRNIVSLPLNFESFEDYPDPAILAHAERDEAGHQASTDLPEPATAGRATAQMSSGGSVSRKPRKRRTFAWSFSIHTDFRDYTALESGPRLRRLAH